VEHGRKLLLNASFCDIPGASVEESSPIIDRKWWEHLILPDLNFTLHPYHHHFPGIPFRNLWKGHEIFKCKGLVDAGNQVSTSSSGSGGGGCEAGAGGSVDPLLPLMVLLSMVGLVCWGRSV